MTRLTIIGPAPVRVSATQRKESWLQAQCACGRSVQVRKDRIVSGKTRSCGCLRVKRGM